MSKIDYKESLGHYLMDLEEANKDIERLEAQMAGATAKARRLTAQIEAILRTLPANTVALTSSKVTYMGPTGLTVKNVANAWEIPFVSPEAAEPEFPPDEPVNGFIPAKSALAFV